MKEIAKASAAKINKRMQQLEAERSVLCELFIEAGRGLETNEETYRKSDPLAAKWRRCNDEMAELTYEIRRRLGYNETRLPRGCGPIRTV